MSYKELKNREAPMWECFFAFSNKQLDEGLEKTGLGKSELLSYGHGLFGSKRGIDKFLDFYSETNKQIAEQCTPQEVYDYEFWNHECEYTGDDADAMEIVTKIFPPEKVSKVNRRSFGWVISEF